MELEHLREYTTLADVRSFTLAARRLHMTQSTLSKHIAALEREFGVELFDRTGKGVVLTTAGAVLYEQALAVGKLMARARQAVRDASSGGRGALPSSADGAVFSDRPAFDVRLRGGAGRIAEAFGLEDDEVRALVLFLEDRPISEVERELGVPRDAAADVLASAYRKLGARDKAGALERAHSLLE